jgi:hypothetical protein
MHLITTAQPRCISISRLPSTTCNASMLLTSKD